MSKFKENVSKYVGALEGVTVTEWAKVRWLVDRHFQIKAKEHERTLELPAKIDLDP